MILLTRPPTGLEHAPCAVALFGAGLIGREIRTALADRGFAADTIPTDWGSESGLARTLLEVRTRLRDAARPGTALAVVWCAGRCGFDATADETAPELRSFELVLRMAEELADALPDARVAFHLTSSAGGVYEGHTLIDADQPRTPRRPYGDLKLRQEDLLLRARPSIDRHVYRPSSVFGAIRPGARGSLIATLLVNGALNRVSYIVGSMTTLRDYVWSRDVGSYIATRTLDARGAPGLHTRILASGRPTSILQVRDLVRRILRGRHLYIAMRPATNDLDITFRPRCLPPDWSPVDLEVSIGRVYLDWLGSDRVGLLAGSG